MTIICAIPNGDETILGCDQKAGDFLVPAKWIIRGQWAIGVSGAYRTQQLLERATLPETDDPFVLATWIRDTLSADGYKPADGDHDPPSLDGHILLATPGRVWMVHGCFATVEVYGLAAIGSGREYALGAAWMASTPGFMNWDDRKWVVERAVMAAIAKDRDGCGGEQIVIVHKK